MRSAPPCVARRITASSATIRRSICSSLELASAITAQLVPISRAEIVNQWSLWWGVAMMVAGALVSLLAKPELFTSAFKSLRGTDYTVADICMQVGLTSVGSFTSSFTKAYGVSPTQYRASFPSAASLARIPLCVLKVYGRPANSTIGEDAGAPAS